ncbi:MAG: 2-hydroxyhepta-2,4-diene,7-dioate isomerase [Microbacteriaceae bacterium]|nr:2-hydroxyhepta-2,4-diene,7-dioate isomerase [Microbacteriaceae bacterium]
MGAAGRPAEIGAFATRRGEASGITDPPAGSAGVANAHRAGTRRRYSWSVKIARFTTGGDIRFGIVDDDEIVVLKGDPMFAGFDTTEERVPLASVKLLAPVIPRSKVVCIGHNYADDASDERSATPLMLLKPNTAVVGPGDAVQLPPKVGTVAHEGELVIVIGRIAKQVKAENFADYVFGYTVGNDVSARDLMESDGQWARAKGYDTFAPLGPVIETEFDPADAEITTFVDGEPRLRGNTSQMLHSIGEIVAFASDVWTLLPGDIIMTGSPGGVGDFTAGQTVDITIEGIGTLSNPARDRD